jgi:hypothetical protein
MDLTQISNLTREAVSRMTSEAYLEAFNSPETGDAFRKRIDVIENSPHQATRSNGNVRGAEQPAQSVEQSFDPSFDDVPNDAAVSAPAPVAAVEPAATEEELPILEHSYQPLSRDGKPVGGLQKFKYRTQQELINKLTAAHMASSARIRELSRDRKLDELASGGRATKVPVPSNEVPETIEELATELRQVRESNYFLAVRAAIADFTASAGWNKYRSKENAESIVLAVTKAGDDPTDVASYHKAFAAMKAFIEPVAQPVVPATVDPTPEPVVAPVAAAATARTAQRVGIATGLSLQDGGDDYQPVEPVRSTVQGVKLIIDGKAQVMTLRVWDSLPSETQRRVLRNNANAAAVNALYEAQAVEQAARRSQRR